MVVSLCGNLHKSFDISVKFVFTSPAMTRYTQTLQSSLNREEIKARKKRWRDHIQLLENKHLPT